MSNMEHKGLEINSLRAKVFNKLQNDILDGKYKPGDSLIETKLAKELGVSRTPIREAIKQLELEELVQTIPNKGAVVTGISHQDIEDIYTIRTMIEGLATRLAAEKMTPEELEQLKEVIELEEFYTNKCSTPHLLDLDSRFHEIIYKASKSRPLLWTLRSFHHFVQRARSTSLSTPGRARQSFTEHKAILQAILDKDPDKAEKLAIKHIKKASSNLLKQMENSDTLKTE